MDNGLLFLDIVLFILLLMYRIFLCVVIKINVCDIKYIFVMVKLYFVGGFMFGVLIVGKKLLYVVCFFDLIFVINLFFCESFKWWNLCREMKFIIELIRGFCCEIYGLCIWVFIIFILVVSVFN